MNFQVEYRQDAAMDLPSALRGLITVPEVAEPWNRLMGVLSSGGGRDEIRSYIYAVEDELKKLPQADHILEHFFADGLYGRLAGIPAGTLFTTPIHKQDSVLTILRGRLVIISEDGIKPFNPSDFVVTTAGIKRLILTLEEVRATTVHANPDNERDISILESRIYAETFDEVELTGEAV
jgi:hypothetical protein